MWASFLGCSDRLREATAWARRSTCAPFRRNPRSNAFTFRHSTVYIFFALEFYPLECPKPNHPPIACWQPWVCSRAPDVSISVCGEGGRREAFGGDSVDNSQLTEFPKHGMEGFKTRMLPPLPMGWSQAWTGSHVHTPKSRWPSDSLLGHVCLLKFNIHLHSIQTSRIHKEFNCLQVISPRYAYELYYPNANFYTGRFQSTTTVGWDIIAYSCLLPAKWFPLLVAPYPDHTRHVYKGKFSLWRKSPYVVSIPFPQWWPALPSFSVLGGATVVSVLPFYFSMEALWNI